MSRCWPQPDFLGESQRRPVVAWLFALVGVLVAGMSLDDCLAARHELVAQRERLARVTLNSTAMMPRTQRTAVHNPISDADALRDAQRIADRIDHPWDRILANLEAESPAGLQWLQFDHDADESTLSLDGASSDVETVMQLVDNLSDRPGWSDVVLGRLRAAETREAVATPPSWHFELHATIDARRIAQTRGRGEL